MGNMDSETFCNCDANDSKCETNFKNNQNQNNDNLLCPFINTIIYQNFNIDNAKKNENVINKRNSKFNFNDYEMNFEYHSSNSIKLKNDNKTKLPNKGIFNLNPVIKTNTNNNDSFNYNNENEYDINDKKNENEDNKIISLDNEKETENNKNSNLNILRNTNSGLKKSNTNNTNTEKTNKDKSKRTPKNGLDIQVWGKNFYYVGYFKDGMADGIGKLITGNSKYFGEYKNDQSNGFGIYHNNINETVYEGYWLNDVQNGCGIEKWSDSSIFIGEYLNGFKSGIGLYIWPDGSRYEGEFKNNKFEGFGMFFYNKKKLYLGEWKNNTKDGYGEYLVDDRLYVGFFSNDQKNGFGMCYWKNKNKIFIGFWKKNKIKGFGKIFKENKMKYGIWGEDNENTIQSGNKKVDFFNDKEAENYMNNNKDVKNYKKFFEYNKEDIISYYSEFYEQNFISPCVLSEKLMK